MPSEIDKGKIKWDPIESNKIQWDNAQGSPSPDNTLSVPEWGQKNPNLYGLAGAAYETLYPIAEAGGMILGGAAGSPAGLPGVIGGGALGYAGAKRVKQTVEEALGLKKPETMREATINTAKDVLEGGTIQAGGEVIGKGIGWTIERLAAPFAKVITPQAREIAELAKQEGVSLTAAEITQSSVLSKIENALGWIPGSAGVIQRYHAEQLKKLVDLREKLLQKIMDGKPIPASIENVGMNIKELVDNVVAGQKGLAENESLAIKNDLLKKLGSSETYDSMGLKTRELISVKSREFADKTSQLYNGLSSRIPEGEVQPMINLKRKSLELLQKELSGAKTLQNKDVMDILMEYSGVDKKTLAYLENMPSGVRKQFFDNLTREESAMTKDWMGMQTDRSKLSALTRKADAAHQTKEQLSGMMSSPEAGVYKQLKKSINEDVTVFSDRLGGDFKSEKDLIDMVYGEGKRLYNSKEIQSILRSNGDKAIDLIFKPDRVDMIRQVKKVIGTDNFEPLSKQFVSKVFDDVGTSGFSWQKASDEFTKYGDVFLKEAIPKEAHRKSLLNMIQKGIDGESLPVTEKFVQDILKKSTPQTVMNIIFQPNNAKNIQTVKDILPPELWNEARTKFTEKLLKENEFGLYRVNPTLREVSKFDDPTLKAIYKPEEYRDLNKFIDISKLAQGAERIAGNPSGTGQAIMTFQAGKAILSNPVTGSMYWLTPAALARIYLSPLGRQYLSVGLKTSVNAGAKSGLVTKILGIAGADAIEQTHNQGEGP